MKTYSFTVSDNSNKMRLDKVLNLLAPNISRTQIQRAIKNNNVTVNDIITNVPSASVRTNDVVVLNVITSAPMPLLSDTDIKLDIVYEDSDLIVLNKPYGLTVHPGTGYHQDTLVNALLYHVKTLSNLGGDMRPGIVHRLDKDTSGLMVVAKNNTTHAQLTKQIMERRLIRKYKALIWGIMHPTTGVINANIDRDRKDRTKMTIVKSKGKSAITYYNTIEVFLSGIMSMIECKLDTGRTHQIRAHCSYRGHSIIGDQLYGNNHKKIMGCPSSIQNLLIHFQRQALHSYYMAFIHPTNNKFLEFETELAPDLQQLVYNLQSADSVVS